MNGLYLGRRPDGVDRLAGVLDELRVYNRALPPTELDQIRTANAAIGEGLVLRLRFDSLVS